MPECYGFRFDSHRHEFIMVYGSHRWNRQCYGANPKYGFNGFYDLLCEPDGIRL